MADAGGLLSLFSFSVAAAAVAGAETGAAATAAAITAADADADKRLKRELMLPYIKKRTNGIIVCRFVLIL